MPLLQTKVIVKTIILSASNKVLILQRSDTDPKGPGLWDLPGGTVEDGEHLSDAACREVQEETGLVFSHDEVELIYSKSGLFENGNRCWLFFVTRCADDFDVTLSGEHKAFDWVLLDDAQYREYFQAQQEALQYLSGALPTR